MEPLDKLKTMTAWESEPALTEDDLEHCLMTACIPDTGGTPPSDEEWEPTYDLSKAAAEAWLLKAGRAAALVEIDPPESGIATSKVFENCRLMARMYAGKRRMSVSLSRQTKALATRSRV